jgi:catechol 2,3-dioxygenase
MRDLDKAREFYCGVLGMKVAEEADFGIFFRFNDYHHDIAVFRTAPDAELPRDDQVGLVHVAVVADSVQTVKAMYDRCKEMGVQIDATMDHGMTKSLYIRDPEGNQIEIYAEVPEFDYFNNSFVGTRDPVDFDKIPATA